MMLDLAVLCCIPLNETEWINRSKLAPCGDFVRFVAETKFNGNFKAAWNFFQREAEFVDHKLESFVSRDISVVKRATTADIQEFAHRYRDVVVIAHWKGVTPLPSDAPDVDCDQIETWDNMLSADDFAMLFPPGFLGSVFMAVCNSTRAAESFRRRHLGAICVCSRDPVMHGLAMAKLDVATRLMSSRKMPLWKGLLEAGELIDSVATRP